MLILSIIAFSSDLLISLSLVDALATKFKLRLYLAPTRLENLTTTIIRLKFMAFFCWPMSRLGNLFF